MRSCDHGVVQDLVVHIPLYFLAEGMRVSLVSMSSSSVILSTVVRYSITRVSRSGRREISKMCSMYDRLSVCTQGEDRMFSFTSPAKKCAGSKVANYGRAAGICSRTGPSGVCSGVRHNLDNGHC